MFGKHAMAAWAETLSTKFAKANTILRVLGPSWESAQRTASELRIPTN